MSRTDKQRITVVAVILLVVAVPVLWQIGTVRSMQAVEERQAELVNGTVTPRQAPNQTVTARQGPNDYDNDSVPDSADRCPTRPETNNGFQDGDGCPDVIATTGAS